MKEKILVSTLELANEVGLGKVSMSQIAERSGLKKSSLYSHYASKEEIIDTMYEYFRKKSVESNSVNLSIEDLFNGRTFEEVLLLVVNSYSKINSDKYMSMFYKMIYSQRTLNVKAAEIIVTETNRMVKATNMLFAYAQKIGVAQFIDIEASSLMFAMSVNQIINYDFDLEHIGKDKTNSIEKFIKEFVRIYGRR